MTGTNEKKKLYCKIGWATAQLYCEKKKNLYCKAEIVLQEEIGLAGNCIAIQQIVLLGCVVSWEENCISIHKLYYD